MSAPETTTSPPVQEGDVLAGKYRVERILGIGGMGVVALVNDTELDQKFALKCLLPVASSSDELVNRFLREGRAAVKLKGTHAARVHHAGRFDNGWPYIVMEYLDGHDLRAEIDKGKNEIAIEKAATYVLQAAEGLAEAHALGIVHRDLKPGNLFLTKSGVVKVLDFGISKNIDPSHATGLSLTRTEMLLGSPLYMSPEQMRSSKHVDERADIWSLGAIAFELLSGRVPFEADNLAELCFKVAQDDVPKIEALRPEIPPGLALAVMRCLEKDPRKRWTNVAELAAAIEPFAAKSSRGAADRAAALLATSKRPKATVPTPDAPIAPALAHEQKEEKTRGPNKVVLAIVGLAAVTLAAVLGRVVGRASDPTATPATTTPALSASAAPPASAPPAPSVEAAPALSSTPAAATPPPVVRAAPKPAPPAASTPPAPSAAPPASSGGFIRVRE